MNHESSVNELPGIGPKVAARLAVLGIHNLADLVFHLPYSYQDRTTITPKNQIRAGNEVLFEGEVVSMRQGGKSRKALLVEVASDNTTLGLRFFHASSWHQNMLKQGNKIRVFGKVSFASKKLEIVHPELERASAERKDTLTPIYPLTYGLNQKILANSIDKALDILSTQDIFSHQLAGSTLFCDLCSIHRAYRQDKQALLEGNHAAQVRLGAVEASLYHHVINMSSAQQKEDAFAVEGRQYQEFITTLPFDLTDSQQKSIAEIMQDIANDQSMIRLLHGDVGSGKTIVAATCMLQTALASLQTVLVAPTTILAQQHHRELQKLFQSYGIKVALYISTLSKREKTELQQEMKQGNIRVVLGTHPLLQKDIQFSQLALAVFDEQHCFGVEQRSILRHKNISDISPHQLVMTATPIPRTLSIVLGGRVALSSITELPANRQPITTAIIKSHAREQLKQRLKAALDEGRQVYWVVPAIEGDDMPSIESVYQELKTINKNIEVLHGQMKESEKDSVMARFVSKEIGLLISTTVISVGVDVANATIMVIDAPEHFGLAQLHQLRGRVGRGKAESSCIILPKEYISALSKQRLEIFRCLNNGLELAKHDLRLRGAGEIVGFRQSGMMDFRFYRPQYEQAHLEQEITDMTMLLKKSGQLQHFIKLFFPQSQISEQTV